MFLCGYRQSRGVGGGVRVFIGYSAVKTSSRDSMKSLNWWWQLMPLCQGCCGGNVNTLAFQLIEGTCRISAPAVGITPYRWCLDKLYYISLWSITKRMYLRKVICSFIYRVSNSTYPLSLLWSWEEGLKKDGKGKDEREEKGDKDSFGSL